MWDKYSTSKKKLNRIGASLTGSDSDDFLNIGNEYFTVTNLTSPCTFNDDINDPVKVLFVDNQFNSCFRD